MHSSIVEQFFPYAPLDRSVSRSYLLRIPCRCCTCTCCIETYSLPHLILPIVPSTLSLFLSLSRSFLFAAPRLQFNFLGHPQFAVACSRVLVSDARFEAAHLARRETDDISRYIELQFQRRTLPPSAGISIRFYSLVLPLLSFFSLYPPFALVRGKVRAAPFPGIRTHAYSLGQSTV